MKEAGQGRSGSSCQPLYRSLRWPHPCLNEVCIDCLVTMEGMDRSVAFVATPLFLIRPTYVVYIKYSEHDKVQCTNTCRVMCNTRLFNKGAFEQLPHEQRGHMHLTNLFCRLGLDSYFSPTRPPPLLVWLSTAAFPPPLPSCQDRSNKSGAAYPILILILCTHRDLLRLAWAWHYHTTSPFPQVLSCIGSPSTTLCHCLLPRRSKQHQSRFTSMMVLLPPSLPYVLARGRGSLMNMEARLISIV
ncbi:hypothetical protein EDB89DRAFT_1227963 [Lactarius sanguifluus]|nr:hypothetical protein EDB89DRAFT_1227963 [Lactarius sanguifluus]